MKIELPIDSHVPQLLDALAGRRDVVLVAEPGAGKTTRVPPAIVRSGLLGDLKLVMLQPRRVAARAAAGRIAREQGWRLGDEVGYLVRFERVMGRDTPLRVLTEGILSRQLVADPSLEGIGCVVLDEFHERSIHSDLSLAMLREAREALREDLRLVVMSATLDADATADFLRQTAEVEILHVPGRLFPVEVEYAGDRHTPLEEQVRDALGSFLEAAAAPRAAGKPGAAAGDVLVFLPGIREIERTMGAIDRIAARAGYDVLPLHGSLNRDEQDRAVNLDPDDRPRVICATNIAETSLTLPGVRLVIDSGLVRQAGYDANRGVETLETVRISRASAEQRAGRAGRVAAGRCVRLWSAMSHRRLPEFDVPEIRRVDLCEASLAVRAWGGDPATFGWFERPEERLLAAATTLLEGIGAVEAGRLTPLGKALQTLPLHPRPARLLTAAPAFLAREALLAAALIGEGAEVPGRRCGTIHDLVEAFERRRLDPVAWRAVDRAREQLGRFLQREVSHEQVGTLEELLLLAYPDRVCRRRSVETATLVDGGGGIRIPDPSALRGDWFIALDVRRGTLARKQQADVRLLAEIDVEWLENHFPRQVVTEEAAEWDEERQQAVAVRRVRYHDLTISEQRGGKPDWQDAQTLLRKGLAEDNAAWKLVSEDDVLGDLYRRWRFIAGSSVEHIESMPLPSAHDLVWEACIGATSREEVLVNARAAAQGLLLRAPHNRLDAWAPREIVVPTGSRIRLDWSNALFDPDGGEGGTRPPVLAVRLQELFGLAETPRVGPPPGVPVKLHLLGPNFRPVQVTSDLASFWKAVYPQVRKDLRARYPKHSWPEDPSAAQPTRGPRRRGPSA